MATMALFLPRRGSSRASSAYQWGWNRLATWTDSTIAARISRRPALVIPPLHCF